MVESRCGAATLGRAYLLPPLSSGGALVVRPWLRFHTPLYEPDMQISRIRLSDKTSRLHPRQVMPKRGQAYELGNPFAFALMSIAFIANFVVFFFRLFYPWPYNLHLLAAAWFIIAVTLGIVVARAVFGGGRITYHRIVGAILLYLLIAVTFATLFAFVGLSIPDAFKGIAFEDDSALASALFYLSFVTLTSTGYGDIVPVHPLARSLCNIESVIGQLYPATILARLVTLELRGPNQ